jgi:hypothetical protein
MATTAFLLLLLAVLVRLGRPRGPLAAGDLPGAALHGVLVLSRLSDRRRERLRGSTGRTAPSVPARSPSRG